MTVNYFLFGVLIRQLISIATLSVFLIFSLTALGYSIATTRQNFRSRRWVFPMAL